MTPEEFSACAQSLLDQFTPDELFDFMDAQGVFDHIKNRSAESLTIAAEPIFNSSTPQWGTHFGKNETAGPAWDLLQLNENGQLFAA